jgi:membrane associated rhomboid family serine protease
MLVDPVVVFRSMSRAACDERAFVLTAVLIDNEIAEEAQGHALLVSARQAAHATHHLHQYDRERPRTRPRFPAMVRHKEAWRGAVGYALVVIFAAMAAVWHWFDADLFMAGAAQSALMLEGQWWRAWTALTLHWDMEHLLGNLGAGALFGYFAAQQLGNGRAWLLVLIAAGAANLVEALMVPGDFLSAGASTAVFATVGLLAAHTWRTRRGFALPGWRRAAPLIGGVLLLAWLGTAGEHTDVLSHGLGFVTGIAAGLLAASTAGARLLERVPQRAAAVFTLGWLGLCWVLALN